ncbi:MAG: hypothetical protein H9W81_22570 [Enterococcus sp.]|nr:hypothetical protein [Enterococcus sp.]
MHISTNNGVSTNVIKAGYKTNFATEGLVDNFEKVIYGFGLLSVSKLPDYFTTCLPSPQKGEPVTLPVGKIPSQNLEVVNKWPDLSTSSNNGSTLDSNRAEYANNNHKYQFLYGEAKNLGANNTLVHKVVGAFGPKTDNGINVNSSQNDYYTTSGNRQ